MFRINSFFPLAQPSEANKKFFHSNGKPSPEIQARTAVPSIDEFCESIHKELKQIEMRRLWKLFQFVEPRDESCYEAELQKLRLRKASPDQLRRIYQKIEACIEKAEGEYLIPSPPLVFPPFSSEERVPTPPPSARSRPLA